VVAEVSFSALFALSPGLAGLLVSSCCFFLAASLLFCLFLMADFNKLN